MKIVFVSNFMNHHQKPISEEFLKISDYKFIATTPLPSETKKLGYDDMNDLEYVVKSYSDQKSYHKAMSLINDSDVVIFGSCPFEMIKSRIESNKLTFRYSERLFKKSPLLRFHPNMIKTIKTTCVKYKKNNYYLLCSGAYVSKDYNCLGAFKNKSFKWGYFPEIEILENKEKTEKLTLLWCGRFINWKHPELAIEVAKYLKKRNIAFQLNMIGNGVLFEDIQNAIIKNNLQNECKLLGALNFNIVKEYMRKSAIFLFTSDRNEGWGAVLNESMASGCLVLANKNIGAAPYLLQDNINGYIFSNKKSLFKKIDFISNKKTNTHEIIKQAVSTIKNEWNEKIAVRRLIEFINNFYSNKEFTKYAGIMEKEK